MRLLIFTLGWVFSAWCGASALTHTPIVSGMAVTHQSAIFNDERRFMVALPEQYSLNQRDYPVLFVIDGDFQFQHVSATVHNLARMGKIAPMVVVGVANQGNADYLKSNTWVSEFEGNDFGGVALFQRYLKEELIPLIEKEYRISKQRALAGYSLGGLFVMQQYIAPEPLFSAFLAFSPSLWFDEYRFKSTLDTYLSNKGKGQGPLFISLANEKGMGVKPVVEVMKKKAATATRWQFKQYPDETHYSTALPALYDGLIFLMPDYFIDLDQMMALNGYQAVLDEFAKKSQLWSGFNFGWLQSYTLSKYFFASKQSAQIPMALKWVSTHYPDSYLEVLINFALGFNKKQQPEQARDLLLSVKEIGDQHPKWHYQLSLSYQALSQMDLANMHHQQALQLAKKHQLESWEYWELAPDQAFE